VALIPEAHPGYIAWDEYEDNQRRLLDSAQPYGLDRRKSPQEKVPRCCKGWSSVACVVGG